MKQVFLNRGFIALVDDEDFERVSAFKWTVRVKKTANFTRYYAKRNTASGNLMLHHFILGTEDRVDHKDNNGLNNQKYNLRPATASQNNVNSRRSSSGASRYRGVFLNPNGTWRSRIRTPNGRVELGSFKDEEDAATAYNLAAEEHHGEFAIFNTPLSSGQPET